MYNNKIDSNRKIRHDWVDALKFLGIFAIYLGHLGLGAGKLYPFVLVITSHYSFSLLVFLLSKKMTYLFSIISSQSFTD